MVKLGKAFPDMLIEERRRRSFSFEKKEFSLRPPFTFYYFFLAFSFFILIARLFYLQVLKGEKYRLLADENRIRLVKKPALRGIIYDRNKKPLVYNVPIYRKIDKKTGKIKIISREEALKMEAEGKTEELLLQATREYIYKEATAHLLGFIGEVSQADIKSKRSKRGNPCQGVTPPSMTIGLGDFVGRGGVEEEYDCLLRGIDGAEIIEVDTFGKVVRKIGEKKPVAGKNLYLTIDISLQKIAQKEMEGKKGAVVAQNPKTGEILSLYSSPSFDPNIFTKEKKEKGKEAKKVLNDTENMPLVNRAIAGTYPSGSTFKIITATAGLEDKKITASTLFEDTGILKVGQWTFPNWLYLKKGEKEGFINIVHAIKRSNDVFFYKLGEKIGIERLNYWAERFGLGKPLGIDLPGELGGLIPNPSWKKETLGENWYLGDTYHLAIGQGYLLVTPLQVNSWTSVIANGGKLCRPHVRKFEIRNSKSETNSKFQILNSKIFCQELNLNKETIKIITEGIKQACEPGGTGWPLFDFKVKNKKIPVACKTGTAEFGDPKNRTHAWFTAFAPVNNPEIAVTVLVEAGGEGSDIAAPIAKKILEEWFKE